MNDRDHEEGRATMDVKAIDQQVCQRTSASYAGPATVLSRDGEIDVTVKLHPRADSDGALTWVGYVDNSDRSEQGELSCVAACAGQYGLILRLPDGREGQFIPSSDISWPTSGFGVSGFLRW